jgi:hypothetical protein
MHATASFVALFSVWIAGVALIMYFFLPSIISSRSAIQSYESASVDATLRQEMGTEDTSFISFSPLAIFDMLQK